MTKRSHLSKLIAPSFFGLALAAGCQAPMPHGVLGADLQLGAVTQHAGQTGVEVHLKGDFSSLKAKLAQRHVQSTIADIDHIDVLAKEPNEGTQTATITAAQIVAGAASATIGNLLAGLATVTVRIYDAGANVIGTASQTATVTSGNVTVVGFNITLNPTYVFPDGTIDTNININNGATITVSPTPSPTPTPPAPSITSIPASASTGSNITISGSNFDPTRANDAVTINGSPATVVSASATSLTVTVPNGATSGPVAVTVNGQTGTSATSLQVVASGTQIGSVAVNTPYGIAFNSQGRLCVTDLSDSKLDVLSASGTVLQSQATDQSPSGIAANANGLLVGSFNGPSVDLFDDAGDTMTTSYSVAPSSSAGVYGVTSNASGTVSWVVQTTGGVWKFNGLLTKTTTLTNSPQWPAVDASGSVWITQATSGKVTKLASDGATVLGTFGAGSSPYGVAIDKNGNAWIADAITAGTVTKLSNSGSLVGTYNVGNTPHGVAIDKNGNVWVTNNGANTVTKLSSSGTALGTFTVGNNPEGIAVDPNGNIWVAVYGGNQVVELAP
ncbi:MAG TPA: IPT/TIG domain-containing protein [Oscillatoriaceae cyanobacterium]